NFFYAASALALGACLWTGPVLADEDDVTAWRLFVSDHAEPVVNVIDALDGDKLDTFQIKGPASLYRTDSGQTVFAVQGGAGAVAVISTGIAFHDHVDHGDIDVDEPELLDATLEGSK